MTSSLRWLRRRGPIVVLLTWVVAIVTLVVAPAPATSYPALASFVVPSGANTEGPGAANEAITLAGVYAQLIPKDDALLKSATNDLGISREQLVKDLTVTIAAGSSLIVLRFEADTPQRSVKGLNDIAIALIAGVSSAITAGSIVEVAAPATNVKTSGLSHTERLLFGIVLGLVLGVIIAVAWGRRDRRVDTPEALRHILGTPVTPLKEVSEWEARSLVQRWLATSERGSKSVAIVTCTSYVRDPARWLEANFSLIGSPGNFGVVSVGALDDGAVDESTSQPKLLFGGAAGSDTALAATLLTDVVVLAITAETPLRDVEAAYRVLAQHAVSPKWGLLVSRAAVRAESRRARESARQARRAAALAANPEVETAPAGDLVDVEPAEVLDLLVTEVGVEPTATEPAVVEPVAAEPVAARPASVDLRKSDSATVEPAIAEAESETDSDEHAVAGSAEVAAADPAIEADAADAEVAGPEISTDDAEDTTAQSDDDHSAQELVADDAAEDSQPEPAGPPGPPVAAADAAETAPTEDEPHDEAATAELDQSDSERAEWAQWADRARAKWARWAEQGESSRADGEAEATPATNGGQPATVGATDKGESNGSSVRPREFGLAGHHNGNGHKGSETVTKT
jgi:capsular polysaccharide biosynthesis protein